MLDEEERDLLYAQQVEQLYSLAPVGIIASLINGPILTYIQWNVISHAVLLTWLSVLVLLNGVWILLWYQFKNASRRPLDSPRWSRRFIAGTLASGLVWGATGVVSFPESSILHQIFLAFVLGGMIAGGTAVYAALQGPFLAYSLPTITPLLIRFFVLGDDFHMAMGGMSLLFVALMFVTLRRNHIVAVASMTLSLQLVKSNQLLQSEIRERQQAEVALRKRELELQQSQEELRALGAQLISAQEDERRRLSRELHDDMNQRLAMVAIHIQSVQGSLPESDPMQETLQQLHEEVASLSDNVRRLAHQLHPSILDDLGLVVALQSFIKDFSKWEHIPVMFQPKDVPGILPQDIALCVYRVIQECLRNVAKHAQADRVSVEVMGSETGLQLIIKDNGKGFTPEAVRPGTHGLGLIGMKERIRVVHGTFDVKASEGKGTIITAWIPLSPTT